MPKQVGLKKCFARYRKINLLEMASSEAEANQMNEPLRQRSRQLRPVIAALIRLEIVRP
jgi:hypothetical protein